jgi:hypothetical protein
MEGSLGVKNCTVPLPFVGEMGIKDVGEKNYTRKYL